MLSRRFNAIIIRNDEREEKNENRLQEFNLRFFSMF